MDPLAVLAIASIVFVGSHLAMSHPLRAPMVRVLGEKGFLPVYALVSLAAIVWMARAFQQVPPSVPLWPGFDDLSWAIASVLTLVAMVLLAGSFAGNPSLPAPGAEAAARAEPRGVFTVTRHPMMWGIGLWAIAHIIAAPTGRTLVVAGAVGFLALAGAALQDGKKARAMGDAWAQWASRTSYWPRMSALPGVGWRWWAIGTVLWLVASYGHIHAAGWAAGVWRWVG